MKICYENTINNWNLNFSFSVFDMAISHIFGNHFLTYNFITKFLLRRFLFPRSRKRSSVTFSRLWQITSVPGDDKLQHIESTLPPKCSSKRDEGSWSTSRAPPLRPCPLHKSPDERISLIGLDTSFGLNSKEDLSRSQNI